MYSSSQMGASVRTAEIGINSESNDCLIPPKHETIETQAHKSSKNGTDTLTLVLFVQKFRAFRIVNDETRH